ncbi:MAG: membrane protein insertase YidC [Candidatus Magasanikbacteria bacterium]|nr:membrane protein insertase YidC [Candidatus Magasanikbacteria bacterium]
MKALFTTILYQPLINLFVGLYGLIPDLGVIILLVTIISKIALYPLTTKSIRAQRVLSELQPKLEALKKEFKDDQQKLATETMKMYREHKINPLSSCLPLLIQLPIFIALYYVLQAVIKSDQLNLLYSFVPNPGTIKTVTLGFLDLHKPSIVLAVLAGASQYWQAKTMIAKQPKPAGDGSSAESMSAMMNKQMLYFMPVLTVIIGWTLPAGLTLYWFFSTILTVFQQMYVLRHDAGSRTSGIVEGKIVS